MSNKITIGELGVMVNNIVKTLDDNTKSSTDFYREVRMELNEIKESNSSLHVRVGVLEETSKDLKPKVESLDKKMFAGLAIGGVIIWVVEHFFVK